MSLVKPGTYPAHPERLSAEKFSDVYENNNGNLILLMAIRLDDSGHVLRHYSTLAIGLEVRQKTVDDLKRRYGWDGIDPFWFETADLSNVQVEAVVEDEPGTDGKLYSRIKWINTPGQRGSYESRQVDRRAISAKYGSLFRACAGAQPVKPAPKAAPKPPAAPPKEPAAPVKPSDLNACWTRLCEIVPANEAEATWFALHKEIVPNKTQDDFTPEDWGRLMARIEAMAAAMDDLKM